MSPEEFLSMISGLRAEIEALQADVARLREQVTAVQQVPAAEPPLDFAGRVVVMGKRISVSGDPASWVRVNFANITAVYTNDTPPDPMPINEEWYEVAETPGVPHCGPR